MVTGARGNAGKSRGADDFILSAFLFILPPSSVSAYHLSDSVSVVQADNKTTGLWQVCFDRSTLPPW